MIKIFEVKRNTEPLNAAEQLALLKQPNPKAPTGLRNLCLLNLMLKTGLRVNEIINLQESALDFAKSLIFVQESGAAAARVLSLREADLLLLKSWQALKPKNSIYFFCTLKGAKLSDRYIREMVKRVARQAGIKKDVYPHLLRYSFAMDFISEVQDLKLLQAALGHREPATTQAYTRLFFDNKMSFAERLNHNSGRSGMPLLDEKQQRLAFDAFGATGTAQKNVQTTELAKQEAATRQTLKRIAIEDGTSTAGNTSTERYHHQATQAAKNKPPKITVNTANSDDKQSKTMPPISCSKCGYIMRYQAACPKCGTSLADTLRHWGKLI